MEEKMQTPPFFFIQMSDVQFGMFAADQDLIRESCLFEQAVAHANRLGPAFIIFTGDLINEPADESQTAPALRIAQNLDKDIPLYWAAGNHDIGDVPTPKNLDWFRSRLGPDWYSFDTRRCHFIVLNSCILQNDELVPGQLQKQLDWLKQDLQHCQTQTYHHIIVFMHHPLFLDDPGEEDQYFNIPRRNRRTCLDLFKKHHIKFVFAGHLHQNRLAFDHCLEMVTTAAVGMPLGTDPSGFRIVEVHPRHLAHRYYGLDELPHRIELDLPE